MRETEREIGCCWSYTDKLAAVPALGPAARRESTINVAINRSQCRRPVFSTVAPADGPTPETMAAAAPPFHPAAAATPATLSSARYLLSDSPAAAL